MLNVVCSIGVMKAHRQAARNRVAVVVRGRLERNEGVTNLVADRVEAIDVVVPGRRRGAAGAGVVARLPVRVAHGSRCATQPPAPGRSL